MVKYKDYDKRRNMKLTEGQQLEIDYFKTQGANPTDQEIEDYINHTIHGIRSENGASIWDDKANNNSLFIKKRMLDMAIKMWRSDLVKGLLAYEELIIKEDGSDEHPYLIKVVDGIMKGIIKDEKANRNIFGRLHDAIEAKGNGKPLDISMGMIGVALNNRKQYIIRHD